MKLAKMKTKALNANMSFGLHRPKGRQYRILVCVNPDCNPPYGCGDQMEVAIDDQGAWSFECRNCDDSAGMLSDVIEAVNG